MWLLWMLTRVASEKDFAVVEMYCKGTHRKETNGRCNHIGKMVKGAYYYTDSQVNRAAIEVERKVRDDGLPLCEANMTCNALDRRCVEAHPIFKSFNELRLQRGSSSRKD